MPDREKVIDGLISAIGLIHGYIPRRIWSESYGEQACRDAIDMLKEQETTDTRQARIFQCKECGYGIEDIFLTSEREYEMVPKYCPNCGRSVKLK